MKTWIVFVFVWLVGMAWGQSLNPNQKAAEELYFQVQDRRIACQKPVVKDGKVDKAAIPAAIKVLLEIEQDLKSPRAAELGKSYKWLTWKVHDIYRDLIQLNLLLGDEAAAADVAKRYDQTIENSTGETRQVFLQNINFAFDILNPVPEFAAAMKKNGAFAQQMKKLRARDGFGGVLNGNAFASPYKPNLSNEEKIAGLAQFWSMVKYNFVFLDKIDFDWNQVMIEYTPKVLKTKSTLEYYRVLQELCARLKDAHTNISFPEQAVKDTMSGRPPIRFEVIDGEVVVMKIFSEKIKDIAVGDVLEKVDGVPVMEYGEKKLGKYVETSTPQHRELAIYNSFLLSGPPKKPVKVTMRRADGTQKVVTLAREGYGEAKGDPDYDFVVRADGIAYCRFFTCTDDSLVGKLKADLEKNPGIKGLIIDLRYNGGGNSGVGAAIVEGLSTVSVKIPNTTYQTRVYSGTWMAWGRLHQLQPTDNESWTLEPAAKRWYEGPCALLIGPRTFSAAEDWTGYWRACKIGPVIGMPTGGSTGQPIVFALPGGGSARVCTKRDLLPDGTEFVGFGIKPDIQVPKTLKGIRAGRDEQLERAVAEISR